MLTVKYFTILIISIFFIACTTDTKKGKLPDNCTVINIENPVDLSIEQLIGDYDTVRLETTDNSLLGSISQLHILDDKLYILNEKSNTIFIFSNTGKYINKIYTVGRGPDEYTRIGNFSVDYINKQIVVIDLSSKKILIYDSEGNHRNTVKLNFLPVRIAPTKTGFVHFCSEPDNPDFSNKEMKTTNIHFLDKSGNFIFAAKQDDTPQKIDVRSDQSLVNLRNGTFLYQPVLSDTVYYVDENSVEIKYIFQSNSKYKIPAWQDRQNISFSFTNRNSISHIKDMISNGYLFSWGEILDSDNYLYAGFSGLLENDKIRVYFNKNKNKAITVSLNNIHGNKALISIFMNALGAADNKYFYTVVPSSLMDETSADKLPEGKLKMFLSKTDWTDTNPLLVKFSINDEVFVK
jgi:hypothetical protein